jgi:hypothetical protein
MGRTYISGTKNTIAEPERFGIDENMFPATELLRVRAWVRRFRTDRARGRAVLVFLRRYVAAREYRAGRRARIQSQHS